MMTIVNRLNEVELASEPLKAAAEKLYAALAAPLPDLTKIKRARDRIPVILDWTNSMASLARSFLKANGGKFHDELRDLWHAALRSCNQSDVDAIRKWLQEQFQIGVQTQQLGVATANESEPIRPSEIAEQPTGDNTPNGPESDSPPDSVGDLQADQVEDN